MNTRLMVVAAAGLVSMHVMAEDAIVLKTQKDKVSYSIGADIGKNFAQQEMDIDIDKLAQGMKDAMGGGKLVLSDDEMRAVLMAMQGEMRQKQGQLAATKGAENKKEGDAFLAKNKAEKDVVTLPSGLQYKILKAGTGKTPVATDSVECHYKGTLINGKEFDSSYQRGEPATFKVGQVIMGWQEALKLMPVGSKWQLFIPSDLAYGPRGAGQTIGPNATLVFEVELLGIK
ncbi:MAG: FKBP-type peptidyl-prolyl cis-trans isomerase [bacterium]